MAESLLDTWLAYYDPIHRGGTPGGIANGLLATNGFFFPRIAGGYNLRRGEGELPDASALIVGAAGAGASSVQTFPWVTHQADTTYTYRLSAIGGGGVENLTDEVLADVSFDALGDWIGQRPNSPGDLRVIPASLGRFELRWTYADKGQQIAPAVFKIYHDSGTGSVDFDNPAASVGYRRGHFHYEYLSATFSDGARMLWAVRAESDAGVDDGNEQAVFGRARAQAPPTNPVVVITRE